MASAMATTEKPIEEKKTSAINSDMKKGTGWLHDVCMQHS